MIVTGATAATARSADTAVDSGNASLNYNAFLQLLMAEMRNQDPTEPTDPTQQMSQLATFSSVEQAIKMNAKLDDLLSMQGLSQAASLIGRTITSAGGEVTGVVKSITVTANGNVAVLEDGTTVAIVPGIQIS